MNALQTIQYEDRQYAHILSNAVYLDTNITANGKHRTEISARIAASMTTFQRLDTFWKNAPFIR